MVLRDDSVLFRHRTEQDVGLMDNSKITQLVQ